MATGPQPTPPNRNTPPGQPGGQGPASSRDDKRRSLEQEHKDLHTERLSNPSGFSQQKEDRLIEVSASLRGMVPDPGDRSPSNILSDPTAAAASPSKPTAPDLFRQQRDNTAALADQLPPPQPPTSPSQTNRTNDLLDEAMGVTPSPPDRLGEAFGGGKGGTGDGGGGGGKPLDVNIVGPLPIPVLITNWEGGSPGGGGERDQPHHRNAYGIDEQGDTSTPLAGQTVQEGFAKFAGGYAAGYPIHNLAQLGKNLSRIGRGGVSALNRMTGGALGTGLGGIGKMVAGSRLGKAAGRGLGRITAALEKKKYGVTGAAKLLNRGAGAAASGARAAGLASGATGGAAAVGGAAAMAGPAAAVVAFGAALVSASQEVYSFARAQEETIRGLSEYNATLAHAVDVLDVSRLERDIRMGEATEDSSKYLTESIDGFEKALAPLQELMTNVANVVGGALLEVITGMVIPLSTLAQGATEFFNWMRGRDTPEAPDATAWDVFRGMSDTLDAAGRRSWPGAGTGAGGPGWSP